VGADAARRVAGRATVPGVLARWWRHRGRAVQAPGCPERWSWTFLRWVWNYRCDSRPRVLAALAEHARHADVVTLRSRAEVRRYLAALGGEQPTATPPTIPSGDR